MNKVSKNLLMTGAAIASVAMPFAVSAQTTANLGKLNQMIGMHGQMHPMFMKPNFKNMIKPATAGTVTAINGTSISITTKDNKSVTVDATAPGVLNIKIGDLIIVEGTLNGTNAVATKINDVGTIPPGSRPFGDRRGFGMGMRHEGAFCTVSAINGSSITLTGPQNEVITVDASAANVSTLKIGDKVGFEGTVKTEAFTATAVRTAGDFKPEPSTTK